MSGALNRSTVWERRSDDFSMFFVNKQKGKEREKEDRIRELKSSEKGRKKQDG